MNSRQKPITTTDSQGVTKKKYRDKLFKKNLAKALKDNQGEPGNIDKIRGNKYLQHYPEDKIVEFVNAVAGDVQKEVEESVTDPEIKEIFTLAHLVDAISRDSDKPQELPLVMKLNSLTKYSDTIARIHGVDFVALNKLLYSAVNGNPDFSDLDPNSQKILHETHAMLLQQIEHDATPEFLEEMRTKICAGSTDQIHPKIVNLAKMFNDETLNPFNFPFEYLLNGTLPEVSTEPIPDQSQAESSTIILLKPKSSPEKKITINPK